MARGEMKCFNCGNLWNFYIEGGSSVLGQGIMCNVCNRDKLYTYNSELYSASLKAATARLSASLVDKPIIPYRLDRPYIPYSESLETSTTSSLRNTDSFIAYRDQLVSSSQAAISSSSRPQRSGSLPTRSGSLPASGSLPPTSGSQPPRSGSTSGSGGR